MSAETVCITYETGKSQLLTNAISLSANAAITFTANISLAKSFTLRVGTSNDHQRVSTTMSA